MSTPPDDPQAGESISKEGASADNSATQRLQFQLFAESVEEYAIYLLDPQGYVISWNPGAERFKGYKASEIIGKHVSTFYTEEDRRAGKPTWELEEATREGRVQSEGWRVRKDGALFWADVVLTAIRDEEGRLLGFGKVTRDLTERKQAEETARQLAREEARRQEAEAYGARLEILRQQLERALQAERAASREVAAHAERQARFREQFIGVLGHDLRNPLSSIKMGTQMLLRDGLPPGPARKVGRIATSAERMERLIGDLLDLTRSRLGGGIPITPQPTDLVALCRHVLDEARATHPGSTLTLHVEGETWGEWDPDRIMQLLSNLVENAISYGLKDGPVNLVVRGEEETVEISVHNEGPEIPENVRELLFDPYRRGAEEFVGEGSSKGLGLGLYISKQIALAHHGSIRFESSRSSGTTFCVVLPRTHG